MSTENMPTTNQSPQGEGLAAKIPPTLAAGVEKAFSATISAGMNIGKSMATGGMGA